MGRKPIERPYDPHQQFVDARKEDLSGTSFAWPNAIHAKLGQLANSAEAGGMPTTRSDLVGAMVAFTEIDFGKLTPEELAQTIIKYRKSTPADIGMTGEEA
jgi:hypothetical protein